MLTVFAIIGAVVVFGYVIYAAKRFLDFTVELVVMLDWRKEQPYRCADALDCCSRGRDAADARVKLKALTAQVLRLEQLLDRHGYRNPLE